jgi:hypothetical protein
MRVGYVDYSYLKIKRQWVSQIVAQGALTGITTRFAHEQQVGAVFVSITTAGDLLFVTEYQAN